MKQVISLKHRDERNNKFLFFTENKKEIIRTEVTSGVVIFKGVKRLINVDIKK